MLLLAALALAALTIAAWQGIPSVLPRFAWVFVFAAYILVGYAFGAALLGVGLVLAVLTVEVLTTRYPVGVPVALVGTWVMWGFMLSRTHGLI